MTYRSSHKDPPQEGQKVYYFGENIGLWVGTYHYQPRKIEFGKVEGYEKYLEPIELCPHVFYCDDGWGNVDACDAPYWLPYDAERESKGWRPLPPKEYLKGLDVS